MGKYSLKKTKNGKQIIYKSKKELQIIQEDIGRVNSGCISNLLRIESAFSNEVIFEVGDYITLKDYLKKNVSIDIMFDLISQTIDTIHGLNMYSMSNTKLVLNYDNVFIDPNYGRFYFMYEPYISDREMLTPNNFWISVIDSTRIKDISLKEQCLQLKQYLMDPSHQELDLIYRYVNKNAPEVGLNTTANLLAKPVNLAQSSMRLNSGGLAEADEGTTLLVSNEPETTIASSHISHAYLVRRKDGQRVDVDKDTFIVGKSAACDYTIVGNSAVSRQHIRIIKKLGSFYMIDSNSTNRTFINGALVEYNREYKLNNGDCIKLANEELDFHII